ncbi:biotin-dependent carboxyltransferase family protein [Microbacterium sp. ZW T5_56]|uniref:5-oxoprolinase subunit C family protein n=1 Tax=Microbacterium sp. ZW T5_56 TaxID=3378081 RepID=UPI003852F976
MSLRVEAVGPGTTVQDLGRSGLRAIGVGSSGAMDRASHRIAQRLVGNRESAAGIEVPLGGLRLRATRDHWIAVTGAETPVTVGSHPADLWRPHLLRAGDVLELGFATRGIRAYVAVRGGLAMTPVLGSRSRDTLAGLGPEPLRVGDELAVGRTTLPLHLVDIAPWRVPGDHVDARVVPGPRRDMLVPEAWDLLTGETWTASSAADRVGARLEGPLLRHRGTTELPSEGMIPGAIQVPPSGVPTILLADGPVTGGYPVIGVVLDLDAIGQLRPGATLRLRG